MHHTSAKVLLVAMPFAGVTIPSIQLPLLAEYLRRQNIHVDEAHLYLKAADIYGILQYYKLISPPNDSYAAQLAYARYAFPKHWRQVQSKCQSYYDKINNISTEHDDCLSFSEYINRSDIFYQWVMDNIDWKKYTLVGFTLNYGQFLPSLAIAKYIKERYPEKIIVFGGSRTTGDIGKHVLEVFDYVDYIVSSEGEEALYQLCVHSDMYQHIPNLIYRLDEEIKWNKSQKQITLDSLPILSFDQFFTQLQTVSPEVQQFFQYHGRIPVEISRGCWWNKCSFCNLNIQHASYREKSVERILEEIKAVSEKYKILCFELIGNTLPKKQYRNLCNALKDLGKDITLFVEARAGQMSREDYILLKEAGFTTIQTGIESFSSHYLQTMNKGARVIDNIAALKFCKENDINNVYNLIVNYPNEEPVDFEQTQNTVQLIQQYLDPPNLCQLRVLYGSPIYSHPEQFNIRSFHPAPIDTLLFPSEVLEKNIGFVFDFTLRHEKTQHNWDDLVQQWKDIRHRMTLEAVHQPTPLNRYVFYFVDGGSFIKIYDKRNKETVQIFTLDADERKVFLGCLDVVSFEQVQRITPGIPEYQLAAILHSFEKNGIVYREDNYYLSLPLSIRPPGFKKLEKQQSKLETNIIHQS